MGPIVNLLLHHSISASHLLSAILPWWRGSLRSISTFNILEIVLSWSTGLWIWYSSLNIICTHRITYILLRGFSDLIQVWLRILIFLIPLWIRNLLPIKFLWLIITTNIRPVSWINLQWNSWLPKHALRVLRHSSYHLHGWLRKGWSYSLSTISTCCANTRRCWHWMKSVASLIIFATKFILHCLIWSCFRRGVNKTILPLNKLTRLTVLKDRLMTFLLTSINIPLSSIPWFNVWQEAITLIIMIDQ